MMGRFMLESEKDVVNIASLERGIYLVKVIFPSWTA